jgi:hypothetical protein
VARDADAHDGRAIENDLARDGAVARTQELIGPNVVERMAAVGSGEPRAVQRVEWGRGGSAVAAERSKTHVERHLQTSSVTE